MNLAEAYGGKRVLVTGDLGFKGTWLVRSLKALGATVDGFDIKREAAPWWRCEDIRLGWSVRDAIMRGLTGPDIVFHLAAQAFVPVGFHEPKLTFETNAQGTVNLLEALRLANRPCAVVVVTTDKVYGEGGPFGEGDRLVPRCPYSASKIAAEHAVEVYRDAYFRGNKIAVATARAGNVIGGGDWGEGRLIPNAVRALRSGKPIPVYDPASVRPWQYVEDVIDGYLRLGAALVAEQGRGPSPFASAFNFGPTEHRTVGEVVGALLAEWGDGTWERQRVEMHEARVLRINSHKARSLLGWAPKFTLAEAIRETVRWYHETEATVTVGGAAGSNA